MPSSYLHRVQAINRNQNVNDVQRGMEIGQEVGKMLGGLSQAIKGAQADSAANQLMTQQNISAQPGAGVTQDLGTLDGGPQPAAQGGAPKGQLMSDPDPDPIQTNQPGASINPDFQPEFTTQDMPDLSGAAKQQKAAKSVVGRTPAGGTDVRATIGTSLNSAAARPSVKEVSPAVPARWED